MRILPLLALVGAAALAGCGGKPPAGASQSPGAGQATPGALPYPVLLAQAQARLAALESAGDAAGAAAAHLELAWLSGDDAHYREADRLATTAALPCRSLARIQLALHRPDAAALALSACPARGHEVAGERAERAALEAEIAFERAELAEALQKYRESLRIAEHPVTTARLAGYHASTGALFESAALLDRAERLDHGNDPALRAWLSLQRADLAVARGQWEDALAYVLRAERHLPGWWRIDEHRAELDELRGDRPSARARFEALAGRTGHPRHMDAVARLLLAQGDVDAAGRWILRARARHADRLRTLPDAAAPHAIEHYLAFAPEDAALARLAQQHLEGRPGAHPVLLLARLHLAHGNARAALDDLAPLLHSSWDTAELHALAAQAYDGLGRDADAQARWARALHWNPRAREQFLVARPRGPVTQLAGSPA